MKNFALTIFLLIFYTLSYSQIDSLSSNYIKYTPGFKFSDGIYLNINQFKENSPIPKSRIVFSYDTEEFDYFDKLLDNDEISLYDEIGNIKKILVKNIWGYSNKGVVYINYNGAFNRVPVIGNICHFISSYTYIDNSDTGMGYDNSSYYGTGTTRTELRQYLLDTQTGNVYDFTVKTVSALLIRDPSLYDEYSSLRRRKKRQLKFLYVRKFNMKKPLMIKDKK